jgi:hypothetical protein
MQCSALLLWVTCGFFCPEQGIVLNIWTFEEQSEDKFHDPFSYLCGFICIRTLNLEAKSNQMRQTN